MCLRCQRSASTIQSQIPDNERNDLKVPKIFFPSRISELWFEEDDQSVNLFSDKRLRLTKYKLNEIGSFIWRLCDGEHSNDEIARSVFESLEGEKPALDEVQADVDEYLASLRDSDLVNWDGEEKLDILLVVPPYPTLYSSKAIRTPEYSAPPLGLAYIGAVLSDACFNVAIYDMHITAASVEDVVSQCRKARPTIVGITATTPTYPNAVRVARLLKAYDPKVTTVLGGVHATSLPEECVNTGAFNFVVIGEGEQPMLSLSELILRNKGMLSEVPGLAYRDESNIVRFNQPVAKAKNLDYLPYPARDMLNLDLYFQKGSIISTRGCPYDCTYCACPVITGRQYRTHSVDYVLDEVAFVQDKYGIHYFDFHDDTFNLIKRRVFEFSEKIIARKMNFKWGCFCRATGFDYEIAKAMKASGCEVVQFGVESGSQEVLDSVRKKATLQEIEDAVVAAKRAGISQIACGFIIGHSSDTEESANETIDFGVKLAGLGATRLAISILTPYPGTEEFIEMKRTGIRLITDDWEQFIFSRVVLETKNLTKDKLRELYAKGVYKFLEATEKSDKGNISVLAALDSRSNPTL